MNDERRRSIRRLVSRGVALALVFAGYSSGAFGQAIPGSRIAIPPPRHGDQFPVPLPVAAEEKPAVDPLKLYSGQVVQPIDLPTTLRLAGARDLDIAIARQRIAESVADLSAARALWLPSLFVGPTWTRLDGQVQTIAGPLITTSRSALFLGATAAGGTAISAAPPGSGYPPVNGLTSVLRFSDAIFEPLAARKVVSARKAGYQATTNDALLAVALAYLELQFAAGRLAVAREAAGYAARLAEITRVFEGAGAGIEANYRRSLTEKDHQDQLAAAAAGDLKVASAEIIRLLNLDPRLVVAPTEPPEMLFRLVSDSSPLDDLVVAGLHHRPELAQAQAIVGATLARLKQARLRPLIPSLAWSYAGGGFGGGQNAFFGNFSARGDAAVSLNWELQNLGFTDLALMRKTEAQNRAAALELMKTQNQVAADVVSAYEARAAASLRLERATRARTEAVRSLELNFVNIERGGGLPGATLPIEVLQPVQALAQVRTDYLAAAIAYNRAQFQLYRALGQPPLVPRPVVAPVGVAAASRSGSPSREGLVTTKK